MGRSHQGNTVGKDDCTGEARPKGTMKKQDNLKKKVTNNLSR